MADTEWFDREPGAFASQSTSDPTLLLVGDDVPDWVRAPPEIGGQQLRVVSAFAKACPKCQAERPVRHLRLEGGYGVAECLGGCDFVWYRRRA